jgi:peptidoglycan/xylan/chitin deacetylase (PgdA/CDA1 family)
VNLGKEINVPGRLWFNLMIDCESTQPAIRDPALGRRSSRGFAEVLEKSGLKGTFYILPSEAESAPDLYGDLKQRGHAIGLHLHPAADGYEEFLGIYGSATQREIVAAAVSRFESAVGGAPNGICVGYASTNDHTYGVLYDLGFRHGMTSIPTRVLPECASVHAGAPLDIHYANRANRLIPGDLDYVEIPATVDPESRMWGGKHPQDLRVELVDAKNHWYTIYKSVERQVKNQVPVPYVLASTHNIFEYGDTRDFRRQTLEGMIRHVFAIGTSFGLEIAVATMEETAAAYRSAVPLATGSSRLTLDRSGYGATTAKTGES